MSTWRTRFHNKWPHLSTLYNSNRELEEDGRYGEHQMTGYDNVFESPDEPYGAYKFYMAPREEFVLQSEPQLYSSSRGSVYSKEDEAGTSDYTTSSTQRGDTCKVLLGVFLAFTLIGVITTAITLAVILSQHVSRDPFIANTTESQVFESSLKVTNKTFTPELRYKNSTEFKDMESDFCKAMESLYTSGNSPLKDLFESCEVLEFSPGSVVVKYRIKLKPQAIRMLSTLPADLQTFLKKMLTEPGQWSSLMIDENSVSEFKQIQPQPEIPEIDSSVNSATKKLVSDSVSYVSAHILSSKFDPEPVSYFGPASSHKHVSPSVSSMSGQIEIQIQPSESSDRFEQLSSTVVLNSLEMDYSTEVKIELLTSTIPTSSVSQIAPAETNYGKMTSNVLSLNDSITISPSIDNSLMESMSSVSKAYGSGLSVTIQTDILTKLPETSPTDNQEDISRIVTDISLSHTELLTSVIDVSQPEFHLSQSTIGIFDTESLKSTSQTSYKMSVSDESVTTLEISQVSSALPSSEILESDLSLSVIGSSQPEIPTFASDIMSSVSDKTGMVFETLQSVSDTREIVSQPSNTFVEESQFSKAMSLSGDNMESTYFVSESMLRVSESVVDVQSSDIVLSQSIVDLSSSDFHLSESVTNKTRFYSDNSLLSTELLQYNSKISKSVVDTLETSIPVLGDSYSLTQQVVTGTSMLVTDKSNIISESLESAFGRSQLTFGLSELVSTMSHVDTGISQPYILNESKIQSDISQSVSVALQSVVEPSHSFSTDVSQTVIEIPQSITDESNSFMNISQSAIEDLQFDNEVSKSVNEPWHSFSTAISQTVIEISQSITEDSQSFINLSQTVIKTPHLSTIEVSQTVSEISQFIVEDSQSATGVFQSVNKSLHSSASEASESIKEISQSVLEESQSFIDTSQNIKTSHLFATEVSQTNSQISQSIAKDSQSVTDFFQSVREPLHSLATEVTQSISEIPRSTTQQSVNVTHVSQSLIEPSYLFTTQILQTTTELPTFVAEKSHPIIESSQSVIEPSSLFAPELSQSSSEKQKNITEESHSFIALKQSTVEISQSAYNISQTIEISQYVATESQPSMYLSKSTVVLAQSVDDISLAMMSHTVMDAAQSVNYTSPFFSEISSSFDDFSLLQTVSDIIESASERLNASMPVLKSVSDVSQYESVVTGFERSASVNETMVTETFKSEQDKSESVFDSSQLSSQFSLTIFSIPQSVSEVSQSIVDVSTHVSGISHTVLPVSGSAVGVGSVSNSKSSLSVSEGLLSAFGISQSVLELSQYATNALQYLTNENNILTSAIAKSSVEASQSFMEVIQSQSEVIVSVSDVLLSKTSQSKDVLTSFLFEQSGSPVGTLTPLTQIMPSFTEVPHSASEIFAVTGIESFTPEMSESSMGTLKPASQLSASLNRVPQSFSEISRYLSEKSQSLSIPTVSLTKGLDSALSQSAVEASHSSVEVPLSVIGIPESSEFSIRTLKPVTPISASSFDSLQSFSDIQSSFSATSQSASEESISFTQVLQSDSFKSNVEMAYSSLQSVSELGSVFDKAESISRTLSKEVESMISAIEIPQSYVEVTTSHREMMSSAFFIVSDGLQSVLGKTDSFQSVIETSNPSTDVPEFVPTTLDEYFKSATDMSVSAASDLKLSTTKIFDPMSSEPATTIAKEVSSLPSYSIETVVYLNNTSMETERAVSPTHLFASLSSKFHSNSVQELSSPEFILTSLTHSEINESFSTFTKIEESKSLSTNDMSKSLSKVSVLSVNTGSTLDSSVFDKISKLSSETKTEIHPSGTMIYASSLTSVILQNMTTQLDVQQSSLMSEKFIAAMDSTYPKTSPTEYLGSILSETIETLKMQPESKSSLPFVVSVYDELTSASSSWNKMLDENPTILMDYLLSGSQTDILSSLGFSLSPIEIFGSVHMSKPFLSDQDSKNFDTYSTVYSLSETGLTGSNVVERVHGTIVESKIVSDIFSASHIEPSQTITSIYFTDSDIVINSFLSSVSLSSVASGITTNQLSSLTSRLTSATSLHFSTGSDFRSAASDHILSSNNFLSNVSSDMATTIDTTIGKLSSSISNSVLTSSVNDQTIAVSPQVSRDVSNSISSSSMLLSSYSVTPSSSLRFVSSDDYRKTMTAFSVMESNVKFSDRRISPSISHNSQTAEHDMLSNITFSSEVGGLISLPEESRLLDNIISESFQSSRISEMYDIQSIALLSISASVEPLQTKMVDNSAEIIVSPSFIQPQISVLSSTDGFTNISTSSTAPEETLAINNTIMEYISISNSLNDFVFTVESSFSAAPDSSLTTFTSTEVKQFNESNIIAQSSNVSFQFPTETKLPTYTITTHIISSSDSTESLMELSLIDKVNTMDVVSKSSVLNADTITNTAITTQSQVPPELKPSLTTLSSLQIANPVLSDSKSMLIFNTSLIMSSTFESFSTLDSARSSLTLNQSSIPTSPTSTVDSNVSPDKSYISESIENHITTDMYSLHPSSTKVHLVSPSKTSDQNDSLIFSEIVAFNGSMDSLSSVVESDVLLSSIQISASDVIDGNNSELTMASATKYITDTSAAMIESNITTGNISNRDILDVMFMSENYSYSSSLNSTMSSIFQTKIFEGSISIHDVSLTALLPSESIFARTTKSEMNLSPYVTAMVMSSITSVLNLVEDENMTSLVNSTFMANANYSLSMEGRNTTIENNIAFSSVMSPSVTPLVNDLTLTVKISPTQTSMFNLHENASLYHSYSSEFSSSDLVETMNMSLIDDIQASELTFSNGHSLNASFVDTNVSIYNNIPDSSLIDTSSSSSNNSLYSLYNNTLQVESVMTNSTLSLLEPNQNFNYTSSSIENSDMSSLVKNHTQGAG